MHSRLITTRNIIESAAGLFLNSGFSNVSMEMVAENAKVTKVTVYQHFRSKEELLLDCLRWRLELREESLVDYFQSKNPSGTQILEIFDWMAKGAKQSNFRGCAFLKATNELGNTIPEVREIACEAKCLLRKRMVGMLRSGGIGHAEAIGDSLSLLFEGAQALSLIEQSERPFRAAKREAQRLIAQNTPVLCTEPQSVRGGN